MSLISIIGTMSGGGGISSPVPPETEITPLFIAAGESNAEGYGDNADASGGELDPNPFIQILNNTSLLFEDLDIGTNNCIGGAFPSPCLYSGWELGLQYETGLISNPLYYVKTGVAGTQISQWDEGDPAWENFKERADAAVALQPTLDPVILYSQGINDANAGVPVATWKAATIAHFEKIRTRYGASVPIVMGKLPPLYSTYNTAIEQIAAEVDYCWYIEVSDLSMKDSYHWDYAGLKVMIARMIDKLLETYTF